MKVTKPGLAAVEAVWQLRRAEDSDDPNDPRFTGGGGDDDDTDDDDGDDTDDDDSDDDSDDDDDEDDTRRKPAKKATKGKKSTEDEDDDRPTWEEYDKARQRMKAADRAKNEANQKLAEAERENQRLRAKLAKAGKGKADDDDEDERRPVEDVEAKAREERREEALRTTRIENAFLRVSGTVKNAAGDTIEWHDAEDALAVADKLGLLDDVLDEDGTVDRRAMARALRELAKRKPHLVNTSKASGKDEEDEDDDEPEARPTTRKVNGRRKGSGTGSTDRAALAKRFPALNRR